MKPAITSGFGGFFGRITPPLLRERTFALLWLAEVIAMGAGHISHLALPIIGTTVLHASPTQMGLLVAFQALPFALLSLPSGVWIDQTSKQRILVGCFIVLAASLALLPAAWFMGWLNMPLLYLVGFLVGAVMTVFGTAHQVLVTHVVGRPRLVDAYRIIQTSESLIRLAAPGLAGLLIQAFGAPKAIAIEVIALAFTLALFVKLDEPASARQPSAPSKGLLPDMLEGLRYCWNDPALRAMAFAAAAWQFLFHGFLAMQILFATRELHMNAGQIGLVHIAGGVGALVSAVLVKRLNHRVGPGNVMVWGLALTTVVWAAFALLPADKPWNMATMALALFLFDIGTVAFFINYISMRQIVTPDALLGRVTATMRFASVALAPLGAIATGITADAIGLRPTFALLGGLGMLAVLGLASYKPFRAASAEALAHPPGQTPQSAPGHAPQANVQ